MDIEMRLQVADSSQDDFAFLIREQHIVTGGGHVERGGGARAKGLVGAEQCRNERRLDHLREPLMAHSGIAKGVYEVRIESTEVEEGLIDIEDDDAGHERLLVDSETEMARSALRGVLYLCIIVPVASVMPEVCGSETSKGGWSMPNDAISTRPFILGDQAVARRLILDGLGEHFGFIDEARNPDLEDISLHYLAAGDHFIVSERGGEIVGTGALIARDGNAAQIVRVSVSSAHRREGIGTALVGHLLAEARVWGFGRVLVETNLDWFDAIRLYVRAGFVEYARDAESVYLAREVEHV